MHTYLEIDYLNNNGLLSYSNGLMLHILTQLITDEHASCSWIDGPNDTICILKSYLLSRITSGEGAPYKDIDERYVTLAYLPNNLGNMSKEVQLIREILDGNLCKAYADGSTILGKAMRELDTKCREHFVGYECDNLGDRVKVYKHTFGEVDSLAYKLGWRGRQLLLAYMTIAKGPHNGHVWSNEND